MKHRKLFIRLVTAGIVMSMLLAGCGKNNTTDMPAGTQVPTEVAAPDVTKESELTDTPKVTEPPIVEKDNILNGSTEGKVTDVTVTEKTNNFIKLALNVYYNDSANNYFKNESADAIYVTEAGQYKLTFDCSKNLSNEAKAAGINSLSNLTAVYILDMGVAEGKQSPVKSCNIRYDAVEVDGVSLTVTQDKVKSAIKSTGVFDTNDPINAWDGSQVAEVVAEADHSANFTTVTNPKVITVTFTLSDLNFEETKTEDKTPVVVSSDSKNTAVFSNLDFKNMDALTLTKYLGNGINLGNTMEAYGHATLGILGRTSSYETYWGQPITTKEMVQGMKDCGFDSIRIPVSWTNMMNYENGDYTINKAYLDRVEEIVNYALSAEMFVIVNDHWDGGWWAMFGSKTPATVDKAWALYTSMWTQIADRFKDYSEMLIFESANEELGDSLNDNSHCADSGALSQNGLYEMTNKINQKFVELVRASGGKNTDRFLLIAGYNTDIDKTMDDRYKMPSDTAKNKLLLSVHYYSPWNYCGAEKQARWGLKSEYQYMNDQFAKLQKFTKAGYGVIIGEYGALPIYDSATGKHTLKDNTIEFTANLLDNCDVYNYCPMLWSCNDFYKKYDRKMFNDELYNLFISRCYAEEEKAGTGYIATVKENMKKNAENAIEMWEDVEVYEPGTPVAWIMWNGGAGTYSVGDTFNPADNTAGIKATNAIIDGAGEYTVSLDFAGGNDGVTFAALGIADAEILYPGCVVLIQSITVDGKKITPIATGYTSSDDGKCTRVNLYNGWVSKIPDDARSKTGLSTAAPIIIDKSDLVGIKNITIKFRFFTK